MGEGRALYNLGNVYHAKGQSYTQRVNKPPSPLMQRLAVAIVFLKGEETAIPGLKSVLSGRIILAGGRVNSTVSNVVQLLILFLIPDKFHP